MHVAIHQFDITLVYKYSKHRLVTLIDFLTNQMGGVILKYHGMEDLLL